MAEQLRRRHALADDAETAELARRHIGENVRLAPVEQLEIYREQFWLRHTSSLVEDFPGLGGIMGQGAWQRLVEEFLEEHPPASYTLRDLGQKLPDFVATRDWLEHRELCVDMARLEWAYIDLFDAMDAARLDPQKLAQVPEGAWEDTGLVLNPALMLLRVGYPVATLRRQLREPAEGNVPIPHPEQQHLVLYRSAERELFHHAVSAGAYALLEALRDGLPLGHACERAIERAPGDAEKIQAEVSTWFEQWARLGWIVDVRGPK